TGADRDRATIGVDDHIVVTGHNLATSVARDMTWVNVRRPFFAEPFRHAATPRSRLLFGLLISSSSRTRLQEFPHRADLTRMYDRCRILVKSGYVGFIAAFRGVGYPGVPHGYPTGIAQ